MITIANRTTSDFALLGTNVISLKSSEFDEWTLLESPETIKQLASMVEQGTALVYAGTNIPLDADAVKALANPVLRYLFPLIPAVKETLDDMREMNPDGRIPKGCTMRVDETGGEYTYAPLPPVENGVVDDGYHYIVPTAGFGYWERTPGNPGGQIQTIPLDTSLAATARTLKVVTVPEDKVKVLEVEIIARSDDGHVGHYVSHLLFRNVGAGVVLASHTKVVEQETDSGWTGIAASLLGDEATVTFLGSAGQDTVSRGSWRELVLEF